MKDSELKRRAEAMLNNGDDFYTVVKELNLFTDEDFDQIRRIEWNCPKHPFVFQRAMNLALAGVSVQKIADVTGLTLKEAMYADVAAGIAEAIDKQIARNIDADDSMRSSAAFLKELPYSNC